MNGFDDPRGHASESLAFEAERALRSGRSADAYDLFARAAELEEHVVSDTDPDAPRVRGVLAVSAVALWARASRWERVEALARHYLASAFVTDEDAKRELRKILDGLPSTELVGADAWLHTSDEVQSYRRVLYEMEARRAGGRLDESDIPLLSARLDQLWSDLRDEDLIAICRDLRSLEWTQDEDESLGEDVNVPEGSQLEPRAA